MDDPYDRNRQSLLRSILGEETARDVANERGYRGLEGSSDLERDVQSRQKGSPIVTTRVAIAWTVGIAWVLAMIIGGAFILSRAVDNDDLTSVLNRQRNIIASQFCEFCQPDENPATMLKKLGLYEVDPFANQFATGYQTLSHSCMIKPSMGQTDLSYEATFVEQDGVLTISDARLAPLAQAPNDLPFLMQWGSIYSNSTTIMATRCIVNSALPYTNQYSMYLVSTSIGVFPCICTIDTGIEECYNFPKNMGDIDPIIDNTNMGIIP